MSFEYPNNSANAQVVTIVVDSNGNLYASGYFIQASGNTANFVAGWNFNGSTWEALGSGLNNTCSSLALDSNGNLYAGGGFTTAGGNTANRIAVWYPNNNTWEALGSGFNNSCSSLAFDSNGNLYAGGFFTTAGGNAANRIAVWYPNNNTWEALGTGMNNNVFALTFDSNGNLYVGGDFTTANGVSVNRIAKWNGTTWSALGSGMNNRVYALALDSNGNVYAGGNFTTAGGNTANRIAVWYPNNSTWEALGSGIAGGNFNFSVLYDLAFDSNDNLYVGGNFSTIDGNSIEDIAVLYSSNNTWSSLGTGIGFSDDNSSFKTVICFAIDSNDNLYVGGFFGTAGGISSKCIAFWNSSNNTWESVGNGVDLKTSANTYVRDLLIDSNDNLYVTGRFNIAYQTNKEFLSFTRAFRGKIFQEPNS